MHESFLTNSVFYKLKFLYQIRNENTIGTPRFVYNRKMGKKPFTLFDDNKKKKQKLQNKCVMNPNQSNRMFL